MTALFLGGIAAVALLSWLHLRPTGTRSAKPIPSLQHLRGLAPPRRRRLQLEERAAWALRTLTVLLALAGVAASRAGCTMDSRPVALLDGDVPRDAAAEEEGRTHAAARLGFTGDAPWADGDVSAQVRAALHRCSDTHAACLLRAAGVSGRTPVLVGPLADADWPLALVHWGQPFAFLRRPAVGAPPPTAPPPPPPLAHLSRLGTSEAAQGWAAALAVAAADAPHPGPPAGPDVAVVDSGQPLASQAALTVVAVDAPQPSRADAPAVQATAQEGLVLPDPLDLAAGTAGLGLKMSLAVQPDARDSAVLPMAALRAEAGQRRLVVAASAEDLGRWAHEGNLLPLARALLAAGLPAPVTVHTPPAGGALAWNDDRGQPAPVGLVDIHPGDYLREDGRVALHLTRPQLGGTGAPSDAQLQRMGGRAWDGPAAPRVSPVALLLAVALALWLAAVWRTRRAWRAWLPAAGVAALLGLLCMDVAWQADVLTPWEVRLGLPPGPMASRLLALARAAGLGLVHGGGEPRTAGSLGTVGLAAAPVEGSDILLFDEGRPRVDVLQVDAPSEVVLGEAAEVWTTVRVRRAAGQPLTLTVRATSAAPASRQLLVDSPDMVRTLHLTLSPLTEGVGFFGVEAAVPGEAQAEDGRLLALAARARPRQRLVLAAAPGWEARAAVEALTTPSAQVASLTQLGRRAVAARGTGAQPPLTLLQQPAALADISLLVLVGFGPGALEGASAAGLRQYVASGGAALLLQSPGAASALGVTLATVQPGAPLLPLAGLFGEEAFAFRGYAPTLALQAPPLTTALGRLGPAEGKAPLPWVLGRGLGRGRLAVVTAPDVWRLSPPGEGGAAYRGLLARLAGWLEAPAASRAGVVLSQDWASLRVEGAGPTAVFPLPAPGPVDGLPVDSFAWPQLVAGPRPHLRAAAAGRRHPFLEVDGLDALAAAWRRLPPAPRWQGAVHARASDGLWWALAALVALEAVARRLYRTTAGGSRPSTDASSSTTGGTTSGDGRSQRDRATPAARAAALRPPASPAA